MRTTAQTRLLRALSRRSIPSHICTSIINEVFFPLSDARIADASAASFDTVLAEARQAKRAVLSNKSKWVPELADLYEQYVQVVQAAIDDIDGTRTALVTDPDNPEGAKIPLSLSRATAIRASKNAKLRAAGKPEGPSCTANWPTWVDPAKRRELIEAFDAAYLSIGRGRGRRFIPFATTSIVKDNTRAMLRHRKFIDDQRDILSDRPDGMGSTHYRALHLCALRMAELWLDNYARDLKARTIHPALNPVPVNWTHMLTPEMRARLREADADPGAVTPEGLTSFYKE